MKLAKAMRYGGELIDAVDCDYSDFKKLIPLCPNCGEPVFLRKGSDRVSKLGKEFKIPAHWSHFDSASEEQKAACKARVSSYTEADRQRIQSKARGQRLKLLTSKIEHILTENPSTFFSYRNCAAVAFVKKDAGFLKAFRRYCESFSVMEEFSKFDWIFEHGKDALDECTCGALDPTFIGFKNYQESFRQAASFFLIQGSRDSKLHKKICREVVSLLSTKKMRGLLQDLYALSFLASCEGHPFSRDPFCDFPSSAKEAMEILEFQEEIKEWGIESPRINQHFAYRIHDEIMCIDWIAYLTDEYPINIPQITYHLSETVFCDNELPQVSTWNGNNPWELLERHWPEYKNAYQEWDNPNVVFKGIDSHEGARFKNGMIMTQKLPVGIPYPSSYVDRLIETYEAEAA